MMWLADHRSQPRKESKTRKNRRESGEGATGSARRTPASARRRTTGAADSPTQGRRWGSSRGEPDAPPRPDPPRSHGQEASQAADVCHSCRGSRSFHGAPVCTRPLHAQGHIALSARDYRTIPLHSGPGTPVLVTSLPKPVMARLLVAVFAVSRAGHARMVGEAVIGARNLRPSALCAS